ncbi:zinc-dependent alcohol dehydrogenase family protein [candidate division KSB1 bacterium]
MKAAVYLGENMIDFKEIPTPEPGPGEVLLEVRACGVCGTDVHIYKGEVPFAKPPVVIGHEIVGEVAALGEGVTDLQEGQSVAVDPLIPCGTCISCTSGHPNMCYNLTVMGYHRTGGFAQYTVTNRHQLHPLPDDMDTRRAVLAEPVACVIHGFDRLNPWPGANILIMGAGPIGLIWTQLLANCPFSTLVQTDLVAERREKAEKLGAEQTIDASTVDWPDAVMDIFPLGPDIVVDASGDPGAVASGLQLVAKSGTFMIFGVCPEGTRVEIDPFSVYAREIKIIGSKMPPFTLSRALRILSESKINDQVVVSHVLPLEMLPDALDWFESDRHRVLKMAINPWLD